MLILGKAQRIYACVFPDTGTDRLTPTLPAGLSPGEKPTVALHVPPGCKVLPLQLAAELERGPR